MFHMVTYPQILDNIKRFSALNVCENPKRLEYKSCLFNISLYYLQNTSTMNLVVIYNQLNLKKVAKLQ